MKFTENKIKDIKLIIWDLDETFWKGTLSDHDSKIEAVIDNINLVKNLSERGIINSVCSKNKRECKGTYRQRLRLYTKY